MITFTLIYPNTKQITFKSLLIKSNYVKLISIKINSSNCITKHILNEDTNKRLKCFLTRCITIKVEGHTKEGKY